MNTETPTIDTLRDDFLGAVKQSQEATLDAVKTVADFVRPIVDALPKPPLATELYEAQRDFARKLFDVVSA